MKLLISLLFAFLSVQACKNDPENKNTTTIITSKGLRAQGEMVEKTFTESFERIRVSSSIKAEVYHSNENKVVISAPESLMERVLVENKGGEVHVRFHHGTRIFGTHNITAKIYTSQLKGLSGDSSANIKVIDKFTQEEIAVQVSSSADIEASLEANRMDISASSSGTFIGKVWALDLQAQSSSSADILLSGTAKKAHLSSSSSGDIKAENLLVKEAELQANSSGDVVVGVEEKANASASSSGDIRILKRGEVLLSQQTSSSGTVKMD